MRKAVLLIVLFVSGFLFSYSQEKAIRNLIDQYSLAREKSDTILLKMILTPDVDQLVSTGEWRVGIRAAVDGMLKRTAGNSGTRTLQVDKIQMLTPASAIVDCRYDIQNADGSFRKMWSSFIVLREKDIWRIRALRNMLQSH